MEYKTETREGTAKFRNFTNITNTIYKIILRYKQLTSLRLLKTLLIYLLIFAIIGAFKILNRIFALRFLFKCPFVTNNLLIFNAKAKKSGYA